MKMPEELDNEAQQLEDEAERLGKEVMDLERQHFLYLLRQSCSRSKRSGPMPAARKIRLMH